MVEIVIYKKELILDGNVKYSRPSCMGPWAAGVLELDDL